MNFGEHKIGKRSLRLEAALTRSRVYERDGHKCMHCHNNLKSHLEDHHINPLETGGTNELDNRITLCKKCHRFFDSFVLPPTKQIVRHSTIEMQITTMERLKELIK